MNGRRFRRGLGRFLRGSLPGLALFAAIAAILINGLTNVTRSNAEEEKRLAEESIRRAVVTCYAVEGFYPPTLQYIKDNYHVRIDESKLYVDYRVFASNYMPDITVLEVPE